MRHLREVRHDVATLDVLASLAGDGVTIFLSTHSLAVAEELCGRIGIIDRGRLVILGTLDELRARAGPDDGRAGAPASLEAVFLDILGAGGDGRA